MKWIDDDAVASARFEPETKIAGKIRERMMNCGGERRGPRSLRTLPKDRQRGSWHAGFLYESKHAPRPRSAGVSRKGVEHGELADRLPLLDTDGGEGSDKQRATIALEFVGVGHIRMTVGYRYTARKMHAPAPRVTTRGDVGGGEQ